jgi:hypothetical protein
MDHVSCAAANIKHLQRTGLAGSTRGAPLDRRV